jgi:predicted lipoprotein with Yx(FWY)xxD motif
VRTKAGIAGLLAAGLLASACARKESAVPSAGGFAQPSSPGVMSPPGSPPPSAGPGPSPSSRSGRMVEPSASSSARPEPSPSAGPVELRAATRNAGTLVVDGDGMTLYAFDKDHGDFRATCTGDCEREWPPALTDGRVTVGPGVNSALASTITRPDGTMQIEYNGWPLYHYAKDTRPGDTKGQGVVSAGAAWHVLDAGTGRTVARKHVIGAPRR